MVAGTAAFRYGHGDLRRCIASRKQRLCPQRLGRQRRPEKLDNRWIAGTKYGSGRVGIFKRPWAVGCVSSALLVSQGRFFLPSIATAIAERQQSEASQTHLAASSSIAAKRHRRRASSGSKHHHTHQSSPRAVAGARQKMIEVICNDRLGKKIRVKCNEDDTIGDLKKLVAAQSGTRPEKIRIQKWYTIFKDHITLEDYEIHDGMGLELYYN